MPSNKAGFTKVQFLISNRDYPRWQKFVKEHKIESMAQFIRDAVDDYIDDVSEGVQNGQTVQAGSSRIN